MGGRSWREVCSRCGRSWELADLRWACTCGGLLDLVGPPGDPVPPYPPEPGASPLARYRTSLPPGAGGVDLADHPTPLREVEPGVFVKHEFDHPTGSFKDRGAAAMVGLAASLGVGSMVVDSSGNAGRSAAAHAAAAGIDCTVFVPEGTAPAKVAAMSGSGARVVEVEGGRAAAAGAARAEVETTGRFYASHVHQPSFHHGVKTLAFELFEQMAEVGQGSVVVPAGNGTLVIGLWLGFSELVAAGRLDRPPALVAVQADRCAPLSGHPPVPGAAPTVASGIAIAEPARADQIRAAVAASGGRVVEVGDEAILAARRDLARMGTEVEPTGAVAWAAAGRVGTSLAPGPVVAVLTGR
jgi:threonine synthase